MSRTGAALAPREYVDTGSTTRDGGERFAQALDDARGWLRNREKPEGWIDHDSLDDCNLPLVLLNPLCRFFKAIEPDPDGRPETWLKGCAGSTTI